MDTLAIDLLLSVVKQLMLTNSDSKWEIAIKFSNEFKKMSNVSAGVEALIFEDMCRSDIAEADKYLQSLRGDESYKLFKNLDEIRFVAKSENMVPEEITKYIRQSNIFRSLRILDRKSHRTAPVIEVLTKKLILYQILDQYWPNLRCISQKIYFLRNCWQQPGHREKSFMH